MPYPFTFDENLWREIPIADSPIGQQSLRQLLRPRRQITISPVEANFPGRPTSVGICEWLAPLSDGQRTAVVNELRAISEAYGRAPETQQNPALKPRYSQYDPSATRSPDYTPSPRSVSTEVPSPRRASGPSYTPVDEPTMLDSDHLPVPRTPEMLEIIAQLTPLPVEAAQPHYPSNIQLPPKPYVNNISAQAWEEPAEFPAIWHEPWAHSPAPTNTEVPTPAPERDVEFELQPSDLYLDRDLAAAYRPPEVGREHILRHNFSNGVLKYTIQTDRHDRATRDSDTLENMVDRYAKFEDAVAAY